MTELASLRWLVIGHGSVGSALVRRLTRAGIRPRVYDPAPRIPVTDVDWLVTADGAQADVAISCVVPSRALDALEAVRPLLGPGTQYLDWNTLTPAAKQAVADAAGCSVVDVALMDTLDDEVDHPSLAVSGPDAAAARLLLTELGFASEVVGEACGDAARLKLARSLFMKSLEALVVEFDAALATVAGRAIVARSIEANLGPQFTAFSRMLVDTDRIHAGRRAGELGEAIAAFRERGVSLSVPQASLEVLRAAARAWQQPDAPPVGAGREALAHYLSRHLLDEGLTHAAD